jgi:hypothetical protein
VWSDEGLLPTQRCVGVGPAGATGLVLREGVVTKVTLEEPLLAQQLPERLLKDHALVQQHIGNAISAKMAYAVASALVRHLRPVLKSSNQVSSSSAPTPTPNTTPTPALSACTAPFPSPAPTLGPPTSVLGSSEAECGVVKSTVELHAQPLPLPPPANRSLRRDSVPWVLEESSVLTREQAKGVTRSCVEAHRLTAPRHSSRGATLGTSLIPTIDGVSHF